MQAFVLDLITVAAVLFWAFLCYRRGFANSVARLVGWVAVFAAASALSRPLADWVYNTLLHKRILAAVEQQVRAFASPEELVADLGALLGRLPAGLGDMLRIDGRSMGEWLVSLVEGVPFADLSAAIVQSAVQPLMLAILGMLTFFVLFTVFGILVRLLASALKLVNHVPVIGRLNALLGAVAGAAQGVLMVLVLAMALRLGVLLTGDGLPFVRDRQAREALLFRHFYAAVDQVPFTIDFN